VLAAAAGNHDGVAAMRIECLEDFCRVHHGRSLTC
jgi:hypothetical protein